MLRKESPINTSMIEPGACALEYLDGLKAVLDSLSINDLDTLIQNLQQAYEQGNQIFIIGNGGSAATASHMACDLAKTVLGSNAISIYRRFRAIALTDNVPLLTAWGNDVSYETIFAEQLRNLSNQGDLLLVITASGNSPNIVEAVKAAQELGVKSIGLLGFTGGVVKGMLDHSILVNSNSYGHVEDAHMILTHMITDYFKQALASSSAVAITP
jgi:D-sedoheptulose 7-phosphate isomerase